MQVFKINVIIDKERVLVREQRVPQGTMFPDEWLYEGAWVDDFYALVSRVEETRKEKDALAEASRQKLLSRYKSVVAEDQKERPESLISKLLRWWYANTRR